MDKEYWENYYAALGPAEQPSDFARFIAKRYKREQGKVFDIGCGNGRDTLFFSSQKIPCMGIEQCKIAIEKNEARKISLGLDPAFFQADFSACDYDSLSEGEYSIYSRFTLHAISYEEESKLFLHLNSGMNLKYLYIEVRSINDSLYGKGRKVGMHEFITTHYRRFIDPVSLEAILSINFDIEYFEEAQGFAKTHTEDPCLIRVIAKRR